MICIRFRTDLLTQSVKGTQLMSSCVIKILNPTIGTMALFRPGTQLDQYHSLRASIG